MNPSNTGAAELKNVSARAGRDGAVASRPASRVVARGLTAAVLMVVATGCGTALNYLQPAAPLYQVQNDRPAQEQQVFVRARSLRACEWRRSPTRRLD